MQLKYVKRFSGDIWNVTNKNHTSLGLWRSNETTFTVTQDGEYSSLLTGGIYSIVDNRYKKIFRQLPDQVTIQKIKIVDRQFQTRVTNYIELIIKNKIDIHSIHTENYNGPKVWHYNGHIFVSGELKDKLIKVGGDKLEFNQGFSRFG
ncbi:MULTISPECIES: hypothetical protein [Niastella]|uniref:Uncharacterized protein n=1 Tax=Niastella soli TaxID=2821487 RepID=A0ABS3Z5L0_9BACT|nr:hypothetical protein [Niastella soli]MBO9205427.1 hypothetical protein [Niastella soli]